MWDGGNPAAKVFPNEMVKENQLLAADGSAGARSRMAARELLASEGSAGFAAQDNAAHLVVRTVNPHKSCNAIALIQLVEENHMRSKLWCVKAKGGGTESSGSFSLKRYFC